MKARTFIAAMLLVVAGVQSALAQRVVIHFADNHKMKYTIAKIDSITFEDPVMGNFDYVDLGLPSGTLWAECNVGAETPEGFGTYFAWGEVEPKEEYWWTTYKYCNGTEDVMLKYFVSKDDSGLMELQPEDDAATFNWGEEWQMPSDSQIGELIDGAYTNIEWTTQNGVAGLKITSRFNGNSIFLPAAGAYAPAILLEGDDDDLVGVGGLGVYWSRKLSFSNTYPYCLEFDDPTRIAPELLFETAYISDWLERCSGLPVRPVQVQETPYHFLIVSIDLNETSLELDLGQTYRLEESLTPWYAENREVSWESSDETVATVEYGEVTAVNGGTCTITCRATDGSGVYAECEVTVHGHNYVDLGLPSGTLWAECNIGAENPSEYGDYFAWGEKEPRTSFSSEQYNNVDVTELTGDLDAATYNWGEEWQIPNDGQFNELFNEAYTTYTWTTHAGINGYKITSKSNGNSIFLPNGGFYNPALSSAGYSAFYWSRTFKPDDTFEAMFMQASYPCSNAPRFFGCNIRPVRVLETPYTWLVTKIEVEALSVGGEDLNPGDTKQLAASVSPICAANRAITWESDDETVATVTNGGLVTAVGAGTCSIIVRATDGSGVTGEFTITVIDPHPYVDLGLPSGTLWATMNIGAESPEQYGTYFAWGETSQKTNYSYDAYTSIDVAELPADKDAATVNWGELWQMPCREQIQELVDEEGLYVTKQWTTQNGVNGWKITSKSNGNSIFLPAAGLFRDEAITGKGEMGGYWGRTLDMDSYAWCIYFNTGYCGYNSMSGATGMTVRPVRVQEEPYTWPVLRLELPATLEINEGESAYLSPLIIPNYAHYDDIVLESSDESVATVSGYEVTAVGSGTCTITCRLTNDSSIFAECQVTVQP